MNLSAESRLRLWARNLDRKHRSVPDGWVSHQKEEANKSSLRQTRNTERKTMRPDEWTQVLRERMLQPGWHNDTYAEEYHRAFFNNYATGIDPLKCGIDDKHIGGLATVPALVAALEGTSQDDVRTSVRTHVSLTHKNAAVLEAADLLVSLLFAVAEGQSLREAMKSQAHKWFSTTKAESWTSKPDSPRLWAVVSARLVTLKMPCPPRCTWLGSMKMISTRVLWPTPWWVEITVTGRRL